MRVQIIQYFVDTEGRLIRRVFGLKDAGHSDAVIAENLTDLQFRYILQPTTTGTNIYDQPISQVGMDERNLVRLVEPSISVETTKQLQDGQTYQVEGTTQIGIRNLQFLEAAVPKDWEGNTALPYTPPIPYVTPTPTPTPSPTPTPTPSPHLPGLQLQLRRLLHRLPQLRQLRHRRQHRHQRQLRQRRHQLRRRQHRRRHQRRVRETDRRFRGS